MTVRQWREAAFAAALLLAGLACELPQSAPGQVDPTVLAQAVQDAQNATVVAGLTVTAALPLASATDAPTATETAAPAVTPTPPAPSPTPAWNWNGDWAVWLNEDAPSCRWPSATPTTS